MITIEDFKKIELRTAEIISASIHPQADKLLVLRIRIGEEERTVVAGIRAHYTEAELVGKKVVAVTNLEPAVIRGVTSEGMILAASDDQTLTLVVPEREISGGAKVK
ncbi:MAG: methionine--tRNA ligase subunit beta [Candidatus Omnitrophica bacterium]|nr:methionine--tRNA ligase subunit beta [Candidatus Omnitrophota bacterium]